MKLVGLYSYRYDHQLVPALEDNISFCDETICFDDRERSEKWYHEGRMRRKLLDAAREAGADWVLCIDPDERLEPRAGDVIRRIIRDRRPAIYRFHFRELYAPDAYRVDGIWGQKSKDILFPLLPGQKHMNLRVHSPWAPVNREYKIIHTGLNLYHFKMIDPANRKARQELYSELDPGANIQAMGYDYLIDETGLQVESISAERMYTPAYDPKYLITQL